MEYEVTVVELPAKKLVGLRERMNIADAKEKCPELWETFMLRYREVADVAEDYSYGVSTSMEEDGDFDYWATLSVSSTDTIPARMECLSLPAAKYGKCVVDFASLEDAYKFLYGDWAKAQEGKGYPVDFKAPCLERYARDWSEVGIELYVPLS